MAPPGSAERSRIGMPGRVGARENLAGDRDDPELEQAYREVPYRKRLPQAQCLHATRSGREGRIGPPDRSIEMMMGRPAETPPEYSMVPHADAAGQPHRGTRWFQPHSLRVPLYWVVALLFMLVIGLGVFGFARLSAVNHVSEVIRNHWLRDTRILGDISNYMTDYRAAEATRLLSSTPADSAASEKEMATLDATLALRPPA